MALQRQSPLIFSEFFLLFLILGLLLSGCAQKTTTHPALEEARSAIQTARSNPSVTRNAPLELEKAEKALGRGEDLFRQKADEVNIEHEAYLARQHAAIAEEIADRREAQATIGKASANRSKVLAEARAAEAEYARRQAEKQRTAAASAQERTTQLEAELAELKAVPKERGLVVTLGDVVFDLDKAELKPGGMRTIDKLADILDQYPDRQIKVEGFTDSTGSAEYNQVLSDRRAQSVRNALVLKGIDPARIETRGYGEEFPKASNETAAGRQLNRRVEIVISNDTEVAPGPAR
jgi:outer membrane protein OmpA-like peptidoglycan-associated protein